MIYDLRIINSVLWSYIAIQATALRERGQDLEKKELIFPQLFKSHRQSITDRKVLTMHNRLHVRRYIIPSLYSPFSFFFLLPSPPPFFMSKPKLKVEIKQQYLVESLESLQPSVSSKELKKYRQMYVNCTDVIPCSSSL